MTRGYPTPYRSPQERRAARLRGKDRKPTSSMAPDDFSLTPHEIRVLRWWAAKQNKPPAEVMHDALWAYFECVRPDFEREFRTPTVTPRKRAPAPR